jgi:hypothetical protein
MTSCFTSAALLAAVVGWSDGEAPAGAAPKRKPTPSTAAEARERLFATCWCETGKVVAGKADPSEPLGWKFGPDEVENWQMTGELVTHRMFGGATISAAMGAPGKVWRMDILSKGERGRISVLPTLFKFEGDTLVWVSEFPGDGWYQEVDPSGNYKSRPTGFESTAQNRYAVYRLKPCDYLQGK